MLKVSPMIAAWMCLPILLGADQRARTEDGKVVILRDDGTWVFATDPPKDAEKAAKPPGEAVKPADSELAYKGKRGTFAMYLVPKTWRKAEKPRNPVAEVEFSDADNEAYAMVIAERVSVPLETLKNAAVQNMKAIDEEAKVVKEEKRIVNGKTVLALIADVKVQGTAFTYYNYYYTGPEGSIQVLTWTGQNLFEELRPKLETFLNGLEMVKK